MIDFNGAPRQDSGPLGSWGNQPTTPFSETARTRLIEVGIDPGGELVEGKLTRATCSCKPTKQGRDGNAWYLYYPDTPETLSWGCWNSECINASGGKLTAKNEKTLTPAEKEVIQIRINLDRQAREAERVLQEQATRTKAARLWQSGHDVSADHEYIRRKGIQPVGIRQTGDMLLVPMSATGTGNPESLQLIFPDGSKKFLTGTGAIPGPLVHTIQGDDSKPLYICEGYATGCSISEATGANVVVAFSSGKLPVVAAALRSSFPNREIIVAGDVGNGSSKAQEAAKLSGCKVVFPVLPAGTDGSDWNDLHQAVGRGEVARQIGAAIAQADKPQQQSLFVAGDELVSNDTRPDWLIRGIMEKGTDVQVVGPTGEGKTFLTIGICCAILTGGLAFDKYPCQQGAILYLAGEGNRGIRRRLKAWMQYNHKTPEDMKHFYVSRGTIALDGDGVASAIEEGRAIEMAQGVRIAAIVVDTMHRHMVGEENSARDTGEYIKAVSRLREAFEGSTTISVHHTGHGEETKGRGRGSSAIPAAMDSIIICDRGSVRWAKQKDTELPRTIGFKLMPVGIGTDEDGEPVGSCVTKFNHDVTAAKDVVLSHKEAQAVTALITVCVENPREENGQFIADQDAWRQEFYRLRRIDDSQVLQDTLKKAFQNVSGSSSGKGLRGRGIIHFSASGIIPLRLAEQDKIRELVSKRDTGHGRDMSGKYPGDSAFETGQTGTPPIGGSRVPAKLSKNCVDAQEVLIPVEGIPTINLPADPMATIDSFINGEVSP